MRKGLSIFLVLSLVVSMLVPFSVSATEFTDLPAQATVQGVGQAVSFETHGDILGGILPTSTTLNFVIDPLGIIGLTAGNTIADANPTNLVIFTGGDVVSAYNTSSVPVVLSVDLSFGTAGSTAVNSVAAVTENNEANVLMWVEPSAEMATRGDTTFAGINRVYAYGTSGDIRFLLDEIAYDFDVTGPVGANGVLPTVMIPVEGEPSTIGTALRFGGVVNTNAGVSWDEVGEMTLRAVFTMSVACAAAIAAAVEPSATIPYGWLDDHTATGGDTYTAPVLIPRPEGVGGQNGGPVPITGTVNAWVRINDPATIIGVQVVDGAWLPLANANIGSWADGIFIRFATPGTRVLQIFGSAGILSEVTVDIR